MIFLKAALLGIVEGLTEFLPISSTGHMLLVDRFLALTPDKTFNDAFMVIIQLPAVLAVVLYFWARLWPLGKPVAERNATILLWTKIVAAFVPAAVIGFLLDDLIEKWLFNAVVVCIALIVGGVILIVLESRKRRPVVTGTDAMSYARAVGVGFIQCIAMVPGTSRSAATIIGAMALGADRKTAAEFSFFLAIPTMLGATALKLLKNGLIFTGVQWGALAVGSVVSFVVAYAVVAFLMRYIQRHDFKVFGYYRIVLGAIVLLLAWA